MDTALYVKLSIVMGLEYAIWGAWMPVLAARLLGPLRFSGKQTAWIYATLPLACIISPLIAGQLADKYFNTELLLAAAHIAGAVLLFIAAAQTRFIPLFVAMLFYSFFYAATLPLVNAVLLTRVTDVNLQGKVFIWAPVAWAFIGYLLTAFRHIFKTAEKGRDCLVLAAILSVVMAAACFFFLPETPPAGEGPAPILKAMSMLSNPSFAIFIIISLVVAGLMQFYFLGSAQLMIDSNIPAKNVSAIMALAQAAQAAATWFALGLFITKFGFKWTLALGATSWLLLYLVYCLSRQKALIIVSQPLHGLAYVFFIIVGQIYAASVAPEEIFKSMQALIFAATTGVGLFLGTQLAGTVMDKFKKHDKFQWRPIFAVPAAVALVSIIVFVAFFKP